MISDRLRKILSLIAMVILIGGPASALVLVILQMALDEATVGAAIGSFLRVVAGSAFLGGVLRLLVSIDARLERSGGKG
ncbi:hypothetical protein [Brevundimonas viscosa]|uniref:Uncharacterized protein n=1 Tax=Brevundimonas viscosa TaxID=871741 RepID=A0A1I6STC6_9CAUL|nr:hypothetical protein [Brevundimonas viscosa]SFS80146.1 hypothetical protein SAMN05192570_2652 [Brevundimonas viscosa]